MGILEQHDYFRKKPIVYYHTIMTKYKRDKGYVMLVCEGAEDGSYYKTVIRQKYPGKEIEVTTVEGKNNILSILEMIDWGVYDREKILFFLDRDFAYWVKEPESFESNVYVTDGYSFENDAVNEEIFLECLEEVYGFSNYTDEEKEKICAFYNKSWESFYVGSYYLMAYIICVYKRYREHVGKDIKSKQFIKIGPNEVWKTRIKGVTPSDYLKSLFPGFSVSEEELEKQIEEFKKEKEHYSIRGKWCITFMVALLDYIYVNGKMYAPSLYENNVKRPKQLQELTEKGRMVVLGPRIRAPESLMSFILYNIGGKNE